MPPAHGRRLAELIPNCRYVEVNDAYTLLPLDQPDAVAAHIAAFATSIRTPKRHGDESAQTRPAQHDRRAT
jgi:hypothetical protein